MEGNQQGVVCRESDPVMINIYIILGGISHGIFLEYISLFLYFSERREALGANKTTYKLSPPNQTVDERGRESK